jgi:hypothetical protein
MGFELPTLVVIGIDCIGSCNSNYHTITTTMAPLNNNTGACRGYFCLIYPIKCKLIVWIILHNEKKVSDQWFSNRSGVIWDFQAYLSWYLWGGINHPYLDFFLLSNFQLSKCLADSDLVVIGLTGIGPIRKISVLGLVFAVLAQWKFLYCIDRFDHIKANII